MQYLKADTITEITIGPVVEVANGYVPVTTLSIASADEAEIIKHGATTTTAITGTLSAITGADGYYALDLSATDTNTEGRLTILINDDSLCLPVRHDFMVVNANVYDSLFAAAATDYLQVDTLQLAGTTQDATDLADFAAAGYDPATNKVQGVVLTDTCTTLTGHTAQTGDTYALANGATGFAAIDTVVDGIQADLDNGVDGLGALKTLIDALNDISTAEVNAEVVDALNTDTYTEPGQGAPAATATLAAKINYLYKAWRNKTEQTATTLSLYDDAGTTVDQKSTVSDDGTTATRGEIVTGP